MQNHKKLTIGILAHVDAGKTTLSEAILYKTGVIRRFGRVDHGDAFLDSDAREKDRGITIFAGQAEFSLPSDVCSTPSDVCSTPSDVCSTPASGAAASTVRTDVILLDTPGHVDFSAEMERTLSVLDYAILVISGKDGIQGHTATLWKLLRRYNIPAFIFVNKMDLDGTDRETILSDLKTRLDAGCFDFTGGLQTSSHEEMAMCDETLLEEFLQNGVLSREALAKAIKTRHIFPCYFGSALKLEGINVFLQGLGELTIGYGEPADDAGLTKPDAPLRTRIFRITRDKQGERLTHMKILSGTLHVRDTLRTDAMPGAASLTAPGTSAAEIGEKVNQIRIYSGDKFRTAGEAGPGTICAVTGPVNTKTDGASALEAIMTYSVILPDGANVHDAFIKLKQLAEEDPQLHITWNEQLQEIQIRLMGQVQLEVLHEIISERFDIDANFSGGRIAYKETITKPVEGAGHYEPLRHYAEVHLLLEPLPRGRGMEFDSNVSEDVLDRNWQRLIMTHLEECEHTGTLTGSPITDMKITLLAGRAHEKHTEGGDFRQATYRAIRQGLRKSLACHEVVLLEPWYEFELEIPVNMIGRAMTDIQRMGGQSEAPLTRGETAVIIGRAPVSDMKDYVTEVASYTKGYGHLSCSPAGYEVCHNQDEICAHIGYDADRDTDNPADSIFCSHGAGHNVGWSEADGMMHIPMQRQQTSSGGSSVDSGGTTSTGSFDNDKELQHIFERTFGQGGRKVSIEARQFDSELERRRKEAERRRRANEAAKRDVQRNLPEFLLVDGYNIIFAWDELKELAKINIDSAREALIDILNNYQGYRKCRVVAVFDAYKVRGGQRHTEKQGNITVVYTAEAETADTYIERMTYEMSGKGGSASARSLSDARGRQYRVRVATSDRLEQIIIMGNDASRVSANDFRQEIEQVNDEIAEYIRRLNRQNEINNPNKLQIP